ncbi:MAG: methyltransferase domain-containing protein [Gemmatimonadetes bacterium]|nr:methyltransferase domain-containing protein [Gemmatimonadota bacterium]
MSCCGHCAGVEEFFDARTAARDLRRYRRRGATRSTRLLLEAIRDATPVRGATLLDVGGGVGAVQHDLLEAGAAHAVGVDASPAYQGAALDEARARGHDDRIDFLTGDAVELANRLPDADVVTLDRVVCCYPDMAALVDATAPRAGRVYAVVLPREWWAVRVAIGAMNLAQRLRRHAFRAYLHGPGHVDRRVRAHGLEPRRTINTLIWQVRVWERPPRRGRPGEAEA